MPDRIGQQLGNYRLLRLLGRGGFAEVYLAEQVYLKRRVALKVLHTSLEDEDVEQFLSEAQTLARLEHPNIVRVFDFAVEQGTPFLAMDYAPRGTLRKLHPRGSCLPMATMVAYVKQVAAALDYAHSQRVIHRDIKPENMLLGTQHQVLLSDFGISLLTATSASVGTQDQAGTISYMAPEQLRGKPVFASDQYALGIVVYEWLCGVRPFDGPYWLVATQHELIPPPPLREKDPSLPEEVEAVVLKALSKEPGERYTSVQEFAQALEQASQVSHLDLSQDGAITALRNRITAVMSVSPTSSPQRVFISAAQADDTFVERLIRDLSQHRIMVTRGNTDHTQHTLDPEEAVRQAIRAAESVLLIASPHARSSRSVKEHLRIASLYQRSLVVVWAAGDELTGMLPGEGEQTVPLQLIDARAERYEEALAELLACLFEESDLAGEPLAEPVEEPRNPYKGLRAFTEDDAADFFGREALTQELVEQVKRLLVTEHLERPPARLLTVLGPSGSGKSSVVMASLVPRLRQGAMAGSEQWVYLKPMMPGTHALEALALTFTSWFPERSVKSIREDLEDESARGLHLLAAQLVQTPEQQVVLFIDQFEELFTLTVDEAERQHFIDVLVTAMTEPYGAVIVVLTLRADFYDRPMAYPRLHQLIETHQKAVLLMTMVDLRAVIKGPAALPDVQLSFEGNLVGDLLFEMQGQVGALPLLQFTLDQLFQRRSGNQLTLKAYREIGGVKGAVAKHAETTYAALPSDEHRRLARVLFLRLIDPGVTALDTTRRRITQSELVLSNVKESVMMEEVLRAFTLARLLTTNIVSGIATVEVSHEAVIREWTRLAEWLDEAREDVHLQRAISDDVAAWEQSGRPRDRLYRGSQLKEAQTWERRYTPSQDEAAFLRASAGRQKRSRISLIALCMLIILLVIPGGLLLWQTFFPPNATVVTTLADSGPGSLRQAIFAAKPGAIITFGTSLRGVIRLESNLSIDKNLTIQGPGAVLLSIMGSGDYNVVTVKLGVTVIISDLAFSGTQQSTFGVAIISNHGNLTLSKSIISDNSTSGGGGGISNDGQLTLTYSRISDNVTQQGYGGGIGNYGGSVIIRNSSISNNMAGAGAGIFNNYGSLTLSNSIVSGNKTYIGGDGGGIYNVNNAPVTIENSTISGNIADYGWGGGIDNGYSDINDKSHVEFSDGGTLSITNSTISDNKAAHGGGILANAGNQNYINFSTIYANTATDDGGGIAILTYNSHTASQVELRTTLVGENRADTGPDISGTLTSGGYNLIQNVSGATFIANKQHLTDVLVDARMNLRIDPALSGRMPQTHALLPGSPAIDRIPLDTCHFNGISTDQRGMQRPDDYENACDIGAFESSQ